MQLFRIDALRLEAWEVRDAAKKNKIRRYVDGAKVRVNSERDIFVLYHMNGNVLTNSFILDSQVLF